MKALTAQLQGTRLNPDSELPGLGDVYQQLLEVVQYPILHLDAFRHLNIEAPKGVLLYG
ncbi:hypothetical protein H4S02_012725, partial [Coemansia sp. RSA 2611]